MSEEVTQNLPNDNQSLILARLDSIDGHLDSIDKRVDSIDKRVDSIDTRLTTLEEKVERRLMETHPIWEQVLSRLDGLETRFDGLEEKMDSGFRRVERQVMSIYEDMTDLRGDNRMLEKRLSKIESE